MKNKNLQAYLFSSVGILAMLALLIGVYVIASVAPVRVDLTEDKVYTLSPGTRAILAKLDTPVQINLFVTQGPEMPVGLKTYVQRVEDLLQEYRKAADGMVEIKKYNPEPATDAEEIAALNGIEGQPLGGLGGPRLFLGMSIKMLDSIETLPFLDPSRERLLEYDISRAISNVANPEKPTVGVMSALPVFGQMNPMMMMQGGGRQEPWLFVSELQRDFDVREIPMTADKIEDDINVLVIVHPKGVTDRTTYAIDQFILRGGKVVAFIDPLSVVDNRSSQGMNPLQAAAQGGSNLDRLTQSWGIQYDGSKVVADAVYMASIRRGQGMERAPAVLQLTSDAVNTNDVVTGEIDNLVLPFVGAFTGAPAQGITQTVLLESSEQSQLIEKMLAEFSGEQALKDFTPSGKKQTLALRLTGKFKTAFPDGAPAAAAANEDESKEEAPAAAPALKEGTKDGVVILVADSDMLYDNFAAQIQNFFGRRMAFPQNHNLTFIQNAVEQLAGDANLIGVRTRATMQRPFTVLRTMEASAQDRYRSKIRELEQSLSETQTKLNQLNQHNAEAGQRFILSPEQQAEIENFKKKQIEVQRELREVEKSLKRDVNALQNRLTWVNIAAMPLLVAFSGITIAIFKRRRTAAK